MSDTSLHDIYKEAAEDAEEFGIRRNFGKMVITPRFLHWETPGAGAQPVEVTSEVYSHLPKQNRSIEIHMEMDLAEFNTELFVVKRRVNIPSSDWKNIVAPSLKKVFGANATIGDADGRYVEVADIPTKTPYKDKFLNVFKFERVFEGRNDCFVAYQELYGGAQTQQNTGTNPPVTPAPAQAVANDLARIGQFPENFSNEEAWVAIVKSMKAQNPNGEQGWINAGAVFGIDPEWSKAAMHRAPFV